MRDAVAFVERYVALSRGQRYGEKRAMWDADEPRPVLRPEEAAGPLVGWPAIDAYWQRSTSLMLDLATAVTDVRATPLAPGLCVVTYTQRWRATLGNASGLVDGPIGATVRVVAGLRDRGAGWRLFFLVEGHVDGAEFVRGLYRARASVGPAR